MANFLSDVKKGPSGTTAPDPNSRPEARLATPACNLNARAESRFRSARKTPVPSAVSGIRMNARAPGALQV
jgi:hypothetical protein